MLGTTLKNVFSGIFPDSVMAMVSKQQRKNHIRLFHINLLHYRCENFSNLLEVRFLRVLRLRHISEWGLNALTIGKRTSCPIFVYKLDAKNQHSSRRVCCSKYVWNERRKIPCTLGIAAVCNLDSWNVFDFTLRFLGFTLFWTMGFIDFSKSVFSLIKLHSLFWSL